jgi:hypothetical protein
VLLIGYEDIFYKLHTCMTSYLCCLEKCLQFMPYKELPSKNQPHGEKIYEVIQSIMANFFLKKMCELGDWDTTFFMIKHS